MPKQPSAHSTKRKNSPALPFLVENMTVLTVPVVSFLYVLPGWMASVTPRGLITLKREGSAGEKHVPAHEVREAFARIETIEDAQTFFGRHGPMDNQGSREISLSHVRTAQAELKRYRQMEWRDFFSPKKNPPDLRHLYENLRHSYETSLHAELKVGERLFWYAEAIDVRAAIKNANCIDHARQVRVGTCGQCGHLFELPPRRHQLYCGKPCQNKATKTRWYLKHGVKQNG